MKSLICALLFSLCLQANDVIKGQTYYMHLLKDPLGFNGAVFSKQYTQQQWQKMFDNDALAFKQLLITHNPTLKPFTQSKQFKKITPFFKAFVTNYAKDVKNSPSCE